MSKLDLTKPLTIDRLSSLLGYDPLTGQLLWLVSTGRVRRGQIAGTLKSGYVVITIDGTTYRAHRLAWALQTGEWPKGEIDHKSRCRSDNTWENLRQATGTLNQANRGLGKNNTSGFKGVLWSRQKDRWRAHIRAYGRSIHIGFYDDPEEAHAAYVAKAIEVFGEFARAA